MEVQKINEMAYLTYGIIEVCESGKAELILSDSYDFTNHIEHLKARYYWAEVYCVPNYKYRILDWGCALYNLTEKEYQAFFKQTEINLTKGKICPNMTEEENEIIRKYSKIC